jgi:hypothetical protein
MHDPNDECQCDDCLTYRDFQADLERKEAKERAIWQPALEEAMQEAIDAINRLDRTRR